MFRIEDTSQELHVDKKVMDNLSEDFLTIMVSAIKERIKDDLIAFLSPSNFIGEALDYMADHSIDNTDEMVKLYSTNICEEFKENFDDLIVFDSDQHKVVISQSIADFELGSYYKPTLKIITKSIELSLKDSLA